MQYVVPFAITPYFSFEGTQVKGFKASSWQHRENVEVLSYEGDWEFVVSLRLKQQSEQLCLVMTQRQSAAHEIAQRVSQLEKATRLSSSDEFAMPMVELDVERRYPELAGGKIRSGRLAEYEILEMYEKIKFRIDEEGAKVENEACLMVGTTSIRTPGKNLILNRPFWVVMRQKGRHPYFVMQVSNTEFMRKA